LKPLTQLILVLFVEAMHFDSKGSSSGYQSGTLKRKDLNLMWF